MSAIAHERVPLFARDGLTLYRGDVLAVLRSLPTASCDACVTDPPYGERVARWDGPRCREWYVMWMREVDRVLAPGAPILTFAPRRRFDVFMSALREVRGDPPECPLQMIVWVHGQGFPPAPGYLRPEHEAIVVSGRLRVDADDVWSARSELFASTSGAGPNRSGAPSRMSSAPRCESGDPLGEGGAPPDNASGTRSDGLGARTLLLAGARAGGSTNAMSDVGTPKEDIGRPTSAVAGTVFEARRTRRRDATGHPTQKPEALVHVLVALTTPPGGSVIDPFCGSGTTLVAARALGRTATGIDRSLRACNIAIRRLEHGASALKR